MSVSVSKFVDFTQIINKDYLILLLEVKCPIPTPLQCTFVVNEVKEKEMESGEKGDGQTNVASLENLR
jgi:hypothetical protein